MTQDEKPDRPTADEQTASEPQPVPPESEAEEEVVPFLPKLIAFAILIGPWALLLGWLQEQLVGKVATSIINMMLLAGIVGFLVLVGYVAKKIHRYRVSRQT